MKKLFYTMTAALALCLGTPLATAAVQSGEPAPLFEAMAASGETVNLEDYRGKIVVLEWTNPECPYVQKHYETGNMQSLQLKAKNGEVVWLTLNSSAPGMQGHLSPLQAVQMLKKNGAVPEAYLLDPKGKIGHEYGASTTPHIFVIDKEGTLVYQGAIDNNSSARHSAVEGAENYVLTTLEALEKGEVVDPSSTQPYGCSVKYAD